jgi:hypothetical protein
VDADERLRLDYDQTTQLARALIDVRFRLLAFVPTVAGVAVAVIGTPRPAAELLGVGFLGLLATLGIFVYELRNTQIWASLILRATELERRLELPSELGGQGAGGLYGEPRGSPSSSSGSSPSRTGSAWGSSTRPRSPAGPTWSPGAASPPSTCRKHRRPAPRSVRSRA